MAGLKKGATQPKEKRARSFFNSLSKAALLDLYVDSLRMIHGENETLDGEELVKFAKETNLETILNLRGDKIPK